MPSLPLFPFVPLLVVLGGTGLAASEAEEGPRSLAIEGVTVVDVESGRATPDRTVVVEGGRIAAVGPADEPGSAADVVVDGRGMFLLPGLFDAHVHYSSAPDLFGPMMLANGVTAARDAGGATAVVVRLRDELAAGERVGPELFVTGAIVDGDPPVWPFSAPCDTPEEARAAVGALDAAGVDQIKVYSRLGREAWTAAIDEAHRRGLKATGHVPGGLSVEDALDAGQDWVDHLTGFDVLIGRHVDGATMPEAGEWSSFGFWRHLARADLPALEAAYVRVAEADTVVCPTLVVMEGIARAGDPSARDEALAQYVPAYMMSFWTSPRYRGMGRSTASAIPPMQEVVRGLHRAGATLVVGTDLANPFVHAGFSVHREMELLQEAGVPAADVLRAATIVPARALGVDDRLGTVRVGRAASLVLVRRNPLVDVRHAAEIEAVVHRGELLDRAALDRLLADARRAAGNGEAAEGDAAVAGGEDGALAPFAPPGEEIARGRLAMSFSGFDAGVEEFALTRHDGGYRLHARSLPEGGFEQPFFVDLAYDGEGRFREGVYRQLVDRPIVATYERDGRVLEAFARRGAEALAPRTVELAADAVVDAPVFAGAFFSLHRLGLAEGEAREIRTVSLGRPTWAPETATLVVERLEDAEWRGNGGEAVRVRRYRNVYETPMGEIDVETWIDPDGVVARAVMEMAMGKLVAERVE